MAIRLALAALALALLSCSQVVRVHTAIDLPEGMRASARSLHVYVAATESETARPPLVPLEDLEGLLERRIEEREGGFDVWLTIRRPRAYVRVEAWLDTNRNDVRDGGDGAGALEPSPVLVEDRGLLRGNLVHTRIVLRELPVQHRGVSSDPDP